MKGWFDNNMKLSYEQNMRASIVFLSMFGSKIEEREDISIGDILLITDKDKQEVGKVEIQEKKIIIESQTELGMLYATYDTVKTTDLQNFNNSKWNTDISYVINKNEIEKFIGTFSLTYSTDDKFGVYYKCRPTLNHLIDDKLVMSLKLERDGEIFGLEFWDKDKHERIKIIPFSNINGYIFHTITKGKYENNKGYSYRKFFSIIKGIGININHLRVLSFTEEDDKFLNYFQFYEKIAEDKKDRKYIVQMGHLANEEDPDMYDRIYDVKMLLTAGDVSLLDNFVNASLESFLSGEEIEALLGILRKPIELGTSKRLKPISLGE